MNQEQPNLDELAQRINSLPEMQRYREAQSSLREASAAYVVACSALARYVATSAEAAAALQAAVRAMEQSMLEQSTPVRVNLEMSQGDLLRKMREIIRENPPVELPFAPQRRTAQWKDEAYRPRGRSVSPFKFKYPKG